MREIEDIEIVEDRTAGSACDEGFLRVRRLLVRNRYADGSTSAEYDCDIVSRSRVDAVAVLLYDVDHEGRVMVALKDGVRPPVWFRQVKSLIHAEDRPLLLVPEMVAGMLEPEDGVADGIERRAAAEALEEAGIVVDVAAVEPLGGPLFASPGITDERVHFRCARVDLDARGEPTGDGSVMEEAGGVVLVDLEEAIERCRAGDLPDMKTEVALLRLRDRLRATPDGPHAS